MNRLLFWLAGFLPLRIIPINGQPYMERYFVCRFFGYTFYLHRYLSKDADRDTHNHPWRRSLSFVLSGWYIEHIVIDLCPHLANGVLTETRKVRWFNSIPGNKFHCISWVTPNTWTLFIHSPRQTIRPDSEILKGWGFLVPYNNKTMFVPFTQSPAPDGPATALKGRDNPERKPLI